MSHLLQPVMEFCLFLELRYLDEANISLSFLLLLKIVLNMLAGNICLRKSSSSQDIIYIYIYIYIYMYIYISGHK